MSLIHIIDHLFFIEVSTWVVPATFVYIGYWSLCFYITLGNCAEIVPMVFFYWSYLYCMYICMYMDIYLGVCMYICVYICMCICVYICSFVYVHVCVCMCVYVCTYTCLCIYICRCIWGCVFIYYIYCSLRFLRFSFQIHVGYCMDIFLLR